jgi:hypothetical protein
MKIKVYLFGTLPQRFSGYDSGQGLSVDLPDHARVRDLLHALGVTGADKAIVTSGGQVKGPDVALKDGMTVQLLQQVHGG